MLIRLADSAVEKNWLGVLARRGKAKLSPPGNFYLSFMHSGVGLGKIFQRGVHEWKLKIGIISLGSGSKSPAAVDDKEVWGRNPQRSEIFTLFYKNNSVLRSF